MGCSDGSHRQMVTSLARRWFTVVLFCLASHCYGFGCHKSLWQESSRWWRRHPGSVNAISASGTSIMSSAYATDDTVHLTFVTGNHNKLLEVCMIMEEYGLPVTITHAPLDLPELQGDPIQISKAKCRLAADQIGGPVFIEDTSLCLHALNGMPGPYIKWFMESVGNKGLFNMLAAHLDKSAYAQCALSFCRGPGHEPLTFLGRCDGQIVEPTGRGGFGWDAIFQPDGFDVTFAMMPKSQKNTMSHRSRALANFRDFLCQELVTVRQT